MSRIAKSPIKLPQGVEFKLDGLEVTVKGGKGSLSMTLHKQVEIKQEDNVLFFSTSAAVNSQTHKPVRHVR